MEFSQILLLSALIKSWQLLASSGEIYPYYLGCFQDHGWPNRAMTYQDKLYAESCILSCISSGKPYAGMESTDQCFCGHSYSRHGVSPGCNIPCPDNHKLSCGGHWKLAVYSAECPPGFWGKNPPCARVCGHCLNPKDCLLNTGECMSGQCEKGWQPPFCEVCALGYFGPSCSSLCHCYENASCNITNGRCPEDKCAVGWQGLNCSTEVHHSIQDHRAILIGVLMMLIVIVVVIIIIIVFRKKLNCFKKKRRLTVAMVSAPVGRATPIRKFSEKSEEHAEESEKFCPDTSLQYLPEAPLPPEGASKHHSNIYISEPALYATVQKPPKSKPKPEKSSPTDTTDDGGYLIPSDLKGKQK